MSGLLAIVGHVEGDAALALNLVQDLVHRVQLDHLAVDGDELGLVKLKSTTKKKKKARLITTSKKGKRDALPPAAHHP